MQLLKMLPERAEIFPQFISISQWAPFWLGKRLFYFCCDGSFTPTQDTAMCVVRCSNNSFGDRCFAAAGPRLQGGGATLPVHLRQCDSLGQFKRLLKTHLFGVWEPVMGPFYPCQPPFSVSGFGVVCAGSGCSLFVSCDFSVTVVVEITEETWEADNEDDYVDGIEEPLPAVEVKHSTQQFYTQQQPKVSFSSLFV